ncbi:YolD-like family protein [Brevibacillus dissolubilis]|uniref:YolD-like family protein n=1 Tax=Brevibacillus dissolubilis TaxID=1844116 RepID=UPI00111732B3|nr:YolD-like family protein [Brevibacillus dissolubilis]
MHPKSTSKKDNLFAASRFVLPEHREMYLRVKEAQTRYVPPELDADELAELSGRIWQASQEKAEIKITYYDGLGEKQVKGHVAHTDPVTHRVKIRTAEGVEWVPYAHLLRVDTLS